MTEQAQNDRIYSKKVLLINKIDYIIEQLEEYGPHTNPRISGTEHHEVCLTALSLARRRLTDDIFENYLPRLDLPE